LTHNPSERGITAGIITKQHTESFVSREENKKGNAIQLHTSLFCI